MSHASGGNSVQLVPALARLVAAVITLGACATARAQLSADELGALRERGQREGWTFTVRESSATRRPLEKLCGLVVPEGWWIGARFDPGRPTRSLPATYDWRDQGACPPVRDQGNCGSCWAFGTVAPLECNILIHDHVEVDLSEQWLVSCNTDGYGCNGGWWAHEYHENQPDPCGDAGAVFEAVFPYVASAAPCVCPYEHPYTIDGWAYVGTSSSVPSVSAIKQAIMDHGPVSAAVYVNGAFQGYSEGVFNSCSGGTVNHAVVLVGWDDDQGSEGVWFLRNSWGTDWGEDGYMRIEYGCSSIGYSACYVEYTGLYGPHLEVTPASRDFGTVAVGQTATRTFNLKNTGAETLSGSASGLASPFSIQGSPDYTISSGQTQSMTIRFAPALQGTFSDTLLFSGGGGASAGVTGNATGDGPSDTCPDAPGVGDGTFAGSNSAAGTSTAATCGGGGTADVWWKYTAPRTGVVVIDTCGSDFDTVLSLHDACDGVELACNDDYGGCIGNTSASRLTAEVLGGQTCRVRVAGCALATGNIVLNIQTTVPTHTISGRVTGPRGAGVAGVTITGLEGDPVTNADGDYVAEVDHGFAGTATPRKTAYTFTPATRSYTGVTSNQVNQDYSAIPPTFTIAGYVTDQFGTGINAVTISGLPGEPVTGTSGRYQATVSLGFSGTVTPSKSAVTFYPASRTYENVTSDLSNEDYDGNQETGSVQVVLEPAAAREAGARWRVDGGDWRESGETLAAVPVGQHTLSYAAVSGWTTPLSAALIISPDQTTQVERTYVQKTYPLTIATGTSEAGEVAADPLPDPYGRYVQDTVVTLTATPSPGYRVRGWSGADVVPAAASETNTVTMTSNRMVLVHFEVKPFHVYQLAAVVGRGEGWVEPKRGAYRAGEVVTVIATPATGCQVKAWVGTDDDASLAITNTVSMDGHKTVSVEFERWQDCNADGVPDRLNIAEGTSADCDADGVPDECQPDTDGDGVIDACDDDFWVDSGGSDDYVPPPPAGGLCGFGLTQALAMVLAGLGLLKRSQLGVRGTCKPVIPTESAAGGQRRNLGTQANSSGIRGQIPQSRRWRVARSG